MHVHNCAPARPGNNAASNDETLLERMKLDDDAGAYRLLVERHVNNAYALALRLLCKSSAAEDVTQDALIKAWTHRHDWEPGRTRFSIWLYRIVVNRCADLQHRPASADVNVIPEPTDVIQCRHVFPRLETALGELPVQHRTALTLTYFDHLTSADVAEVMGTTESTVESWLSCARSHLREVLRGSEADMHAALGFRPK
ncbi:RNA polymerase sigma-70 factor, ECF subfamily [Magnetospirillum fulvum]|uniref:RNA polymerase sigma-70 factor, ECF subfamily n=2 Tax=Magnetospirillum fulvum TaxID=1082 RepID=A0A1H6I0H7_MAGFU|nr:RNA polymerase sigma-70 factor, ECF subfamily [Magnetospirillum fulvum]